ncbi:MAG TPA: hypothetical protein PK111_05205 [Atribacterota bacterium]|nr:hypothetical protein [Atribacterota bacterium]
MKGKRIFLLITIMLMLVFLVTGCNLFTPPVTKNYIKGRVLMPPTAKVISKDITGWIPAANAQVTIVDANGKTHTVTTDSNGNYRFENIEVNTNTIITATITIDGKKLVLKGVIPQRVTDKQNHDVGTMDPESTALALVVEHLLDSGVGPADIDLDAIKSSDSFSDLLDKVTSTIEGHGNVTQDPAIVGLVDDVEEEVNPSEPEPVTPPGGGNGGTTTIPVSAVIVEGVDDLFVGTVLTSKTTPTGANVNYQWLRANNVVADDDDYEAIDGATGKTYELTANDAGKYIKVKVEGKGSYKGTVISEEAVGPVETLVPGDLVIAYKYNDKDETKTAHYVARDRAYEKLTLPVGAALQSLTVAMDGVADENKDDVKIEFKKAPSGYESPWGTLEWKDGKWELKSANHTNYQNLQENEYELQATFISLAGNPLTIGIEVEVSKQKAALDAIQPSWEITGIKGICDDDSQCDPSKLDEVMTRDKLPSELKNENGVDVDYQVTIKTSYEGMDSWGDAIKARNVTTYFTIPEGVTVWYPVWENSSQTYESTENGTGPFTLGMEGHPLSAGNIEADGIVYIALGEAEETEFTFTIKLVDAEESWEDVVYGEQELTITRSEYEFEVTTEEPISIPAVTEFTSDNKIVVTGNNGGLNKPGEAAYTALKDAIFGENENGNGLKQYKIEVTLKAINDGSDFGYTNKSVRIENLEVTKSDNENDADLKVYLYAHTDNAWYDLVQTGWGSTGKGNGFNLYKDENTKLEAYVFATELGEYTVTFTAIDMANNNKEICSDSVTITITGAEDDNQE